MMPKDKGTKDYGNFDNQYKNERDRVFLIGLVIIFLLLGSLLSVVLTRGYAIYQASPSLNSSLAIESICFNGFHTITKKAALDEFVTSKYKNFLKSISYKPVNLSPSLEDFILIRRHGDSKCKIVVKSKTENSRNLRSFIVSVVRDKDFIFDYKVNDISEILLTETDLKGGR